VRKLEEIDHLKNLGVDSLDNIKLVLQEIGLEGVDWIGLDQLVTSCRLLFIL
jgi:hypothetical protein